MTVRQSHDRRRWRRCAAVLVTVLAALLLSSVAAARTNDRFSFTGEAQVLEMTVSREKAVYGLAMSGASFRPAAAGIGAGQCRAVKNVGLIDPACSAENSQMSSSSGPLTKPKATCSQRVAKPRTVVAIRTACGKSTSTVENGLPSTKSSARVPGLTTTLELDQLFALTPGATRAEIEAMSEYLAERFSTVLGTVAQPGSDLVRGVTKLVTNYLDLAGEVDRGQLIRMRFGRALSAITPNGGALSVESTFSGARIGFLPVPTTRRDGSVRLGDPLRDGLVVIDVSPAKASVQVDRASATSTAYAASAVATVSVRDISSTKPRYVDLAVASGEELTLFDGTPWRSTISIGSSLTKEGLGLADAAAEPVRLTVLEAMGGVTVEVGRASARGDLTAESSVPAPKARTTALPATGAARSILIPIASLLGAAAVFFVGRRARSRRQIAVSEALQGARYSARRILAGLLTRGDTSVDLSNPVVRAKRIGYRSLAGSLALTGIVFLSYPFATDVWAWHIESGLRADLSQMATKYVTKQVDVGDPLTRLEIPRLDIDTVVAEGITEDALRAGAGHYPMTPLPGEPGNVAIAGHRTSFGSPFRKIDRLMPGDEIILTTPVARHTYRVLARPSVTDPHDWSIITDYLEGGSYLTLTSCHPEGSAAYRIWVRAELVRSDDMRESAT